MHPLVFKIENNGKGYDSNIWKCAMVMNRMDVPMACMPFIVNVDDKNLCGSIVALDSGSSEFHILAGIEVHVELDLAFQGVQLFLAFAHAADDDNSCDDN